MFQNLTSSTIPQLMAERLILRAQLAHSRAENARLREELECAHASAQTVAEQYNPARDYRLVLDNPDLGWPADLLADARAWRDAEIRAVVRK